MQDTAHKQGGTKILKCSKNSKTAWRGTGKGHELVTIWLVLICQP